jgi:hypothetical protein
MKIQIFKLIAILSLFMGCFSCTDNEDESIGFQWDDSKQQEEFRPINPGGKSSSFKIDDNIISFAVPYLVGTWVNERPPEPGWGSPEGFSPHIYSIWLILAKGTDVTKLAPVITLAPGATITLIEGIDYPSKQVDYSGIAEVGMYNFIHQIDFIVRAPSSSIVIYKFVAIAIGAVNP